MQLQLLFYLFMHIRNDRLYIPLDRLEDGGIGGGEKVLGCWERRWRSGIVDLSDESSDGC